MSPAMDNIFQNLLVALIVGLVTYWVTNVFKSTSISYFGTEIGKAMADVFDRLNSIEKTVKTILERDYSVQTDIAELKLKNQWLEYKLTPLTAVKGDSKLVLLVDDRAEIMEGIVDMLRRNGYIVNTALTFEAGLSELETVPYAYAIIDASLSDGELDGIRLAEICEVRFPNVKVFIHTGHDLDYIPAKARLLRKNGFQNVLTAIERWQD